MEPFLADAFLDRVGRAYHLALKAGARTPGVMWKGKTVRVGRGAACMLRAKIFLRRAYLSGQAADGCGRREDFLVIVA